MKLSTLSATLLLCSAVGVNGFFQIMAKNPIVKTISESQVGTLLDIRLDVGSQTRDGAKMSINGLLLKLSEELNKNKNKKNAGAEGANSSGGVRSLKVVKEGQFIDMTGLRKVQVKDGSWEVVWKQEELEGAQVVMDSTTRAAPTQKPAPPPSSMTKSPGFAAPEIRQSSLPRRIRPTLPQYTSGLPM